MGRPSGAIFLLIIYFLITFGYSFSLGFYYLPGLILLTVAFLLLALFYFHPKIFKGLKPKNPQPIFAFAAMVSIALSLVAYGGLYQNKGALSNLSLLLLVFALLISLTYLFLPSKAPSSTPKPPPPNLPTTQPPNRLTIFTKHRFLIFLSIAFLLRLFMIVSSPKPQIDVFDILKNGPTALLQGQNPYTATFSKTYTDVPANYFAYPPGALFFALPGNLLFNDPRFIFVIAEVLAAFLVFSLSKSEPLALLWLFNPRALFALEQSWLDSLIASLLLLSFYLWIKLKKKNLAMIVFGVTLPIKQSLIFLPLFLAKVVKFRKNALKRWGLILFTISFIVLPFFLWNPSAFIDKIITSYFESLQQRKLLLHRSMGLNSFWFENFQSDLSLILLVGLTILLLLVTLLKQKEGWSQFFLATTLFYFGMFLFSQMAFLNFYYFIGQLILTTIAILLSGQKINNPRILNPAKSAHHNNQKQK